ncbi:MAG: hypothetical protein MJZ19_05335 [Paludibacteraceae bacterium]|nr:hypothetical protein [Paludibacteraceae bacterium]
MSGIRTSFLNILQFIFYMENLIRFLAIVVANLLAIMSANAATWESSLEWNKGIAPTIIVDADAATKAEFKNSATVNIKTEKCTLKCRGDNGAFWSRREVQSIDYEFLWQYSIEGEDWVDIKAFKGNWKSNSKAPSPEWSGNLKFTEEAQSVTFNGININHTIYTDKNYNKSEIKVYFRLVYSLALNVEGKDKHDRFLSGEEETEITLYRCSAGTLGISTGTSIPKISENIFGIYDTKDYKNNHYIHIVTKENYLGDIDSFKVVDEKDNEFKLESSTRVSGEYDSKVRDITYFEKVCEKEAVKEWDIKFKMAQKNNISCYSNSLTFKHFNKITLGEIRKFEAQKFICASSSANSNRLIQR